MKRILLVVVLTAGVFFLLISSSFAASLYEELQKRGLSPGIIEKGVLQSLGGGNLTVNSAGENFSSTSGKLFDLVISKSGNGYRVVSTRELSGLMFTGQAGKRNVAIFVVNGKGYVGVKTDGNFQLAKAETVMPARQGKKNGKGYVGVKTDSNVKMANKTLTPNIIMASSAKFVYSNEIIQVPADTERR